PGRLRGLVRRLSEGTMAGQRRRKPAGHGPAHLRLQALLAAVRDEVDELGALGHRACVEAAAREEGGLLTLLLRELQGDGDETGERVRQEPIERLLHVFAIDGLHKCGSSPILYAEEQGG